MQVKEIMSEKIACCTRNTNLQEAARMMVEHDCGALPVVESERNHKPVGVITDRDIVCRAVAEGKNPLEMTVADCMTDSCITVSPDSTLEECCQILEQHQIRRVPVVDQKGECCGVVSQADIARQAPEHETAEVLREVSRPNPQTASFA